MPGAAPAAADPLHPWGRRRWAAAAAWVHAHTQRGSCCPHGMLAAANSSGIGIPFCTLQCWCTHSRVASMLRKTLLAVCTKCSAMSSSMPGCSVRIRSTSSTLSSHRLQDVHALHKGNGAADVRRYLSCCPCLAAGTASAGSHPTQQSETPRHIDVVHCSQAKLRKHLFNVDLQPDFCHVQ